MKGDGKRTCTQCGRTLSKYNRTGECFHHSEYSRLMSSSLPTNHNSKIPPSADDERIERVN